MMEHSRLALLVERIVSLPDETLAMLGIIEGPALPTRHNHHHHHPHHHAARAQQQHQQHHHGGKHPAPPAGLPGLPGVDPQLLQLIASLPRSERARLAKHVVTTARQMQVISSALNEDVIAGAVEHALERLHASKDDPADLPSELPVFNIMVEDYRRQQAATTIQRAYRRHLRRRRRAPVRHHRQLDREPSTPTTPRARARYMEGIFNSRASRHSSAGQLLMADGDKKKEEEEQEEEEPHNEEEEEEGDWEHDGAEGQDAPPVVLLMHQKTRMRVEAAAQSLEMAHVQLGRISALTDHRAGYAEDPISPYAANRLQDLKAKLRDIAPDVEPPPQEAPAPEVRFADLDPMEKARRAMAPMMQHANRKTAPGRNSLASVTKRRASRSSSSEDEDAELNGLRGNSGTGPSGKERSQSMASNGGGQDRDADDKAEGDEEAAVVVRSAVFNSLMFGRGLAFMGEITAAADQDGADGIASAIRHQVETMQAALPTQVLEEAGVEERWARVQELMQQAEAVQQSAAGMRETIAAECMREVERIYVEAAAALPHVEVPTVPAAPRDTQAWRKQQREEDEAEQLRREALSERMRLAQTDPGAMQDLEDSAPTSFDSEMEVGVEPAAASAALDGAPESPSPTGRGLGGPRGKSHRYRRLSGGGDGSGVKGGHAYLKRKLLQPMPPPAPAEAGSAAAVQQLPAGKALTTVPLHSDTQLNRLALRSSVATPQIGEKHAKPPILGRETYFPGVHVSMCKEKGLEEVGAHDEWRAVPAPPRTAPVILPRPQKTLAAPTPRLPSTSATQGVPQAHPVDEEEGGDVTKQAHASPERGRGVWVLQNDATAGDVSPIRQNHRARHSLDLMRPMVMPLGSQAAGTQASSLRPERPSSISSQSAWWSGGGAPQVVQVIPQGVEAWGAGALIARTGDSWGVTGLPSHSNGSISQLWEHGSPTSSMIRNSQAPLQPSAHHALNASLGLAWRATASSIPQDGPPPRARLHGSSPGSLSGAIPGWDTVAAAGPLESAAGALDGQAAPESARSPLASHLHEPSPLSSPGRQSHTSLPALPTLPAKAGSRPPTSDSTLPRAAAGKGLAGGPAKAAAGGGDTGKAWRSQMRASPVLSLGPGLLGGPTAGSGPKNGQTQPTSTQGNPRPALQVASGPAPPSPKLGGPRPSPRRNLSGSLASPLPATRASLSSGAGGSALTNRTGAWADLTQGVVAPVGEVNSSVAVVPTLPPERRSLSGTSSSPGYTFKVPMREADALLELRTVSAGGVSLPRETTGVIDDEDGVRSSRSDKLLGRNQAGGNVDALLLSRSGPMSPGGGSGTWYQPGQLRKVRPSSKLQATQLGPMIGGHSVVVAGPAAESDLLKPRQSLTQPIPPINR